ncbi:MAG TPA: metallopeptidase family protein [Myxococcaceae bacterium]|nr:metallopeptidase family protein [Myxococcaceae bacterium]
MTSSTIDPEVRTAFAEAEAALDRGAPEAALPHLSYLEGRVPEDPELALLKAGSHFLSDRPDEAIAVLEAAHARHPGDLGIWVALAGALVTEEGDRPRIEAGLELAARGLKRARKTKAAGPELALLQILGTGHNTLGESRAALAALDAALALDPEHPDTRLERALALFELCRFDEAASAMEALGRDLPDEPWVHHTLGLIAERRGDHAAARTAFDRAHQLDPDAFPRAIELGEDAFDAAVQDALDRLPDFAQEALENTPVAVEPLPSDEDLLSADPPLSPTILGLFRGQALPHRELMNPTDHFPATVLLYQKNLERFARTREELLEQIGITVLHEVGHLLGLDEDDLAARGLE